MQMGKISFCAIFCIRNIVPDTDQMGDALDLSIFRTPVQPHNLLDSCGKIVNLLGHRLLKDGFAVFALKYISFHENPP